MNDVSPPRADDYRGNEAENPLEKQEDDLSLTEEGEENTNDIYNDKNNKNNKGEKNRNISPKLIFGVILVLAAVTLAFGVANISQTLYGAKNKFNPYDENLAQTSTLISDLLEMQSKDTDKDGLNDYEELYTYKTSPYLADTDGDGYPDKQEIDGGYDPLCPKGQDCRGTENTESTESTQNTNTGNQNYATGTSGQLSPEVIDELNKLTPAEVRQILKDSGQMTDEQLGQIDDVTLMEVYRQVLQGQ